MEEKACSKAQAQEEKDESEKVRLRLSANTMSRYLLHGTCLRLSNLSASKRLITTRSLLSPLRSIPVPTNASIPLSMRHGL